jgi:hypothetical protein
MCGMTPCLYTIYPIDSKPFGYSYSRWSERWWRWLLSIPQKISPAFDITGSNTKLNQNNPNIFFLCQTIEGIERIPTRRTTVPAGRAIFMPIINWISVLDIDGKNEDELHFVARDKMDKAANLEVEINGAIIEYPLNNNRVHSSFFTVELPADNILRLPSGPRGLVSDGYWICFYTNSNRINLSTFGSCSSGKTRIGMVYDIEYRR